MPHDDDDDDELDISSIDGPDAGLHLANKPVMVKQHPQDEKEDEGEEGREKTQHVPSSFLSHQTSDTPTTVDMDEDVENDDSSISRLKPEADTTSEGEDELPFDEEKRAATRPQSIDNGTSISSSSSSDPPGDDYAISPSISSLEAKEQEETAGTTITTTSKDGTRPRVPVIPQVGGPNHTNTVGNSNKDRVIQNNRRKSCNGLPPPPPLPGAVQVNRRSISDGEGGGGPSFKDQVRGPRPTGEEADTAAPRSSRRVQQDHQQLPDFKAQVREGRKDGTDAPRPGPAVHVANDNDEAFNRKTRHVMAATSSRRHSLPPGTDAPRPGQAVQVANDNDEAFVRKTQHVMAATQQQQLPDYKDQVRSDIRLGQAAAIEQADTTQAADAAAAPATLDPEVFHPSADTFTASHESEADSTVVQHSGEEIGSSTTTTAEAAANGDSSCVQAFLVPEEPSALWGDASPLEDSSRSRRFYFYIIVVVLALVGLVVGLVLPLTRPASTSSSPTDGTGTAAAAGDLSQYNCSLPGLEDLTPGSYAGVQVNYLSFATYISSPNFPVRAEEFEACTGGTIVFSDADNIWNDPVQDLVSASSGRGSEVYDGYLMSYSHFPEVSALGLAENLNDRVRQDNARLKWEDVLPKVKTMGEYRKDGMTNIDFLMYDGDFFLPIIRLDLLQKHSLPLPNTWEETVDLAKYFHGMDLNDDGEPDYGFCHFPRAGEGYFDAWWPELVYSTWATSDQKDGIQEGFFFDTDTMEPRLGAGFSRAALIWRDLWNHGNGTTEFITGRCAIGFAPPGDWKPIFLTGVSRKDQNGTTVWQPTMQNGEYALPYRFKPFGSLEVFDRRSGAMTPCTADLCPKAEVVPIRGHHGDNDRANVLPASPIAGQLINRAPFYWTGGLGTLIRKSAPAVKKDMLWDFFVYTNSPDTAAQDVASYVSWLDSWRYSQLTPGDNFLQAGWSQQAYEEHKTIQEWGLSADVNGALNLRIPGVARYTSDVLGELWSRFIEEEITLGDFVVGVEEGWNEVTDQQGRLEQLGVYRAALGRDPLSDAELCRLHLDLMVQRDPSSCSYYYGGGSPDSSTSSNTVLLVSILIPSVVVIILIQIFFNRKRNIHEVTEDTIATG